MRSKIWGNIEEGLKTHDEYTSDSPEAAQIRVRAESAVGHRLGLESCDAREEREIDDLTNKSQERDNVGLCRQSEFFYHFTSQNRGKKREEEYEQGYNLVLLKITTEYTATETYKNVIQLQTEVPWNWTALMRFTTSRHDHSHTISSKISPTKRNHESYPAKAGNRNLQQHHR